MGMGTLGLISLLGETGLLGQSAVNPLAPREAPHHRARTRRVIHIFANGGPSHVDTFDPKPELTRRAGQALPRPNLPTERRTGAAFPSPFRFRRYGQSGIEVSEIFENVAQSIDDICVIRSMHADVPNHEPSLLLMNCGEARLIRPSLGSWVTYGLGTENQNLPGFIAMCPGGYPIQESQNWQAGFLPGIYQGTYINTQHTQIERLIENIRNTHTTPAQQRRQLDLLRQLNERHQAERAGDAQLEARIQSFELASRMQIEAADAFDISREPQSIRNLYGEGTQARQLLIARRLLERGVRFVQVWHGAGQPWDNHDDIEVNHRRSLARPQEQGHARRYAGDLGGRVWPDSHCRVAHARGQRRAAKWPRPQPPRLHHVAGRRRCPWWSGNRGDRRVRLCRCRGPRPRPRPARHHLALAGLRSRALHLSLRGA
jgi:hypothetical protein